MSDLPIGERVFRKVRSARDLRSGDKVVIRRELVTIDFASHIPARRDKRAISMMTRGRDIEGTVLVGATTEKGQKFRHEFEESEIVTIY